MSKYTKYLGTYYVEAFDKLVGTFPWHIIMNESQLLLLILKHFFCGTKLQ